MTRAPLRLLALLSLCVAALAEAELPPQAYAEDQAGAPEHLTVRVLEVHTKRCTAPCLQPVKVMAEVVEVHRSRAGVKKGQRITVRYEHRRAEPGWVGPSPVPVLKVGERVPAFLSRRQDTGEFAPAAGGYSFREVPGR